MNAFVTICLIFISENISLHAFPTRIKRADGRANIPVSDVIRKPAKLLKGQPPASFPGWSHCIKHVTAKSRWKAISSAEFTNLVPTQFQCTWMIKVEIPLSHVEISVQKLQLGKYEDRECKQQFLEIIDSGKTQGRYCDGQKPGDYVASGSTLRLDMQGEGTLANLIRKKKIPFLILYRATVTKLPGFRITTAKLKKNDYYNFPGTNIRNGKQPSSHLTSNTDGGRKMLVNQRLTEVDDDEAKNKVVMYGVLNLTGLIAVIVCSVLVTLVILVFIIKRCFCIGATKQQEDNRLNEKDSEVHLPPAIVISGHVNKSYLLPDNEVIIASQVIRTSCVGKCVPERKVATPRKSAKKGEVRDCQNKRRSKSKPKLKSTDANGQTIAKSKSLKLSRKNSINQDASPERQIRARKTHSQKFGTKPASQLRKTKKSKEDKSKASRDQSNKDFSKSSHHLHGKAENSIPRRIRSKAAKTKKTRRSVNERRRPKV